MGKARLRRPSPGTVLGGLAVVVAMSGVAVAAIPGGDGTVTACVSKGGEVKLIDVEAGATCPGSQTTVKLASTDATGKVANADKLDGKDSADFLGAKGDPGDPGTARAYGLVEFGNCLNGVCTVERAKNVVAVRRVTTGVYCITAVSPLGAPTINPATDLIMAGVEHQETVPPQGNASAMGAGTYVSGGCDPATEFKVVTQRSTATTTASPADNVSFWLAIP